MPCSTPQIQPRQTRKAVRISSALFSLFDFPPFLVLERKSSCCLQNSLTRKHCPKEACKYFSQKIFPVIMLLYGQSKLFQTSGAGLRQPAAALVFGSIQASDIPVKHAPEPLSAQQQVPGQSPAKQLALSKSLGHCSTSFTTAACCSDCILTHCHQCTSLGL